MAWKLPWDKSPDMDGWSEATTAGNSFFRRMPPLTISEISEPRYLQVERLQSGQWIVEGDTDDRTPFRMGPFERDEALRTGASLVAKAMEQQKSALVKDSGLDPEEWRFQWHDYQNAATPLFVNVSNPDIFIAKEFGTNKFYVGAGGTPSRAFFNGAAVHTDSFETPLEALDAYSANISHGM